LKNNLFFRNSLFIETTFLKKLLSSKQTGPKKEEEEKDLIPNLYIYIYMQMMIIYNSTMTNRYLE
jgi:hypothetical protein